MRNKVAASETQNGYRESVKLRVNGEGGRREIGRAKKLAGNYIAKFEYKLAAVPLCELISVAFRFHSSL